MPRSLLIVLAVALGTIACNAALPDPDSPGAVVMRQRCGGCHRIAAPSTMTFEMWKVQVERMRDSFTRARLPWLTSEEQRVLLEYLQQHAGQG